MKYIFVLGERSYKFIFDIFFSSSAYDEYSENPSSQEIRALSALMIRKMSLSKALFFSRQRNVRLLDRPPNE